MQQEQSQQHYLRSNRRAATPVPDAKHRQEGWGFHQYPGHLVVDAQAPFLCAEQAVPGSNEIQADEDHDAQANHGIYQAVKALNIEH